MPPEHFTDEIVHKALSSDIRRCILLSLEKDTKYLSQIAQEAGKKPQSVDFHLNILSEIGLVKSEWREGKKFYALTDKRIVPFLSQRKPLPEKFHHLPPHEIVIEAMERLEKRLDRIEKKIEALLTRP